MSQNGEAIALWRSGQVSGHYYSLDGTARVQVLSSAFFFLIQFYSNFTFFLFLAIFFDGLAVSSVWLNLRLWSPLRRSDGQILIGSGKTAPRESPILLAILRNS